MSTTKEISSGAAPDLEALVEVDLDLSDIIEAMEVVDWTAMPTISTAEAAALQARLVEARECTVEEIEAAEDARDAVGASREGGR